MPIDTKSTGSNIKSSQNESNKKEATSKESVFIPEEPKYTFKDIILNDSCMNEILDILSFREKSELVFQKWGLNKTHKYENKVAINFYGASGTGKTMAAHAVASHYNKKIIPVNYADIESKYVGDTPKNLTKVFEVASKTDSVLLFDEADAILSKRVTNMSSSTDTSVNQTRSVLLILLNNFQGIVIFTTNFLSNFDHAFMRRILGHIEFTLPDLETRKKIWGHLIPDELPHKLDIDLISEKFSGISGSDISNAILKSSLKAARNNDDYVPHDYFVQAIQGITKSNQENADMVVSKRVVSEEYVKSQLNNGVVK